MMIVKFLWFLAFLTFSLNAITYGVFPPRSKQGNGGTVFEIEGEPGIYNLQLKIYDATGNLVWINKTNGFRIFESNHRYCFDVWNHYHRSGLYKVAGGTYAVQLEAINTSTGSSLSKQFNIGILISSESILPILYSANGDKIIKYNVTGAKKAIVFFEGYDPGNTNSVFGSIGKYANLSDRSQFPGYDFLGVDWKNGGASLHQNVINAIAIIKQISTTFGYSEIVLIGKSMGAVIGRYALAKAENEGANLPVTKFISLDAPQQGAQVNLTAQASIISLTRTAPDFLVPVIEGLAKAIYYKETFLYSSAGKELLYYNIGLVENKVNNSTNACPINLNDLNSVRFQASKWRNDFFATINKCGNRYGYPAKCKTYGISYTNGNLVYSRKTENMYMADFTSYKYKLYSDIQDINTGSLAYKPDLASQLSMQNEFDINTVFIPLESALDLRNMDYAKTNGVVGRNLTNKEILEHSPFDKVYLKTNRVDHGLALDAELLSFIQDAINDNSPKFDKVIPQNVIPIVAGYLLND